MTLLRVEHFGAVEINPTPDCVKIPMTLLRVEHSSRGAIKSARFIGEDSDDSIKS